MPFSGSDHNLTELVWSPEIGLSLRCANNSKSADQKPFFLWNVGSSTEDLPPSHKNMKSDGNRGDNREKNEDAMSGDKAAAGTLAGPSTRFLAPEIGVSCGEYDGKNSCIREEEVGTTKDVIPVKESCTDNGDDDFADISRKDVADRISDCKRDNAINEPFPTQLNRNTHCNHSNNNMEEINTGRKEGKGSEVDEALVGSTEIYKKKNKSSISLPIPAHLPRQEKSKGKALSDESDESCNNSAILYSKGIIKRHRDDDGQELMIQGSKRMKRQTTMDSSFMKWISNMVKGPPEMSAAFKEKTSSLVLAKPHNYSVVSNTGFQTMFQSLYCKNMEMLANGVRTVNDSTEESNQLIENLPGSKSDNSCRQIAVVSDKEAINRTTNVGQSSRPQIFSADIIPSDSFGKQVNTTEEKSSAENVTTLKSLWITRFCTRTPGVEKRATNRAKSNTKDCNKSFPMYNIFTAKDKVVPLGIFHAIRNLRLNRSDILRWMNSNVSLPNLNGFFLRLRLGKMEEGIGATSYYVAYITGDARKHCSSMSKNSILVDVGGIKSSVESRYVSNHDFLEDEIMAWWCRAVESGFKVPSLEELNSKLIDRKSRGF